ncbi:MULTISPECIES: hypothetical protein [Bacillus]|uniref:hypothetical protein n=1 Tax=Bacillus pumilus TaxID=1408 RepID=UPI002111E955|nr:hypothetical protein [Bacillus pumilus]UUD44702.1 hypothetical protein NPA43_18875 [Bacillus pumilus]
MNKEEIKKWMEQNLVGTDEAREITGQSRSAFNQALETKRIIPFFSTGEGTGKRNLYLKSDLEEYYKNKKKIK